MTIRECNISNTASTPNISDVCTAAAVDTACARGYALRITYWYTSISTYKGTVCLSRRTYRYSHEARMNVLSVEQCHSTYCRPADRLHARKQSVARPRHSDIADYYIQLVVREDVCSIITTGYICLELHCRLPGILYNLLTAFTYHYWGIIRRQCQYEATCCGQTYQYARTGMYI